MTWLLLAPTALAADYDYFTNVCSSAAWNNPDGLGTHTTLFCDSSDPIGNDANGYRPPIERTDDYDGSFSARMLYSFDDDPSPDGLETTWDPAHHHRCADGTEPYIYIDLAEPSSNDWILFFQGGQSCYASADATQSDYFRCQTDYSDPGLAADMSSDEQPRTKNFNGILSGTGTFASYNRVWISKCGYDRYLGDNWDATSGGTSEWDVVLEDTGAAPDVVVTQQGGWIGLRVAELLDSGAQFLECSSDPCTLEDIPPLCDENEEDPQTILLVGHSTGAHGLIQLSDGIADRLRSDLGCDEEDDIISVLDAHFMPMLEGECRYEGSPCAGIYSGDYSGTSTYAGATSLTFDTNFYTDSTSPRRLESSDWGAVLSMDESCLAAHAGGSLAPCFDQFHVLANHLTTPFFLTEWYWDTNGEHNPPAGGYHAVWGSFDTAMSGDDWNYNTPRTWFASAVLGFGAIANPAAVSPDTHDYPKRVRAQAAEVVDTASERTNAAHPEDAPNSVIVGLDCKEHGAVTNTTRFEAAKVWHDSQYTPVYSEAGGDSLLQMFVAGTLVGPIFIDGANASESGTVPKFCYNDDDGSRGAE